MGVARRTGRFPQLVDSRCGVIANVSPVFRRHGVPRGGFDDCATKAVTVRERGCLRERNESEADCHRYKREMLVMPMIHVPGRR
jgi:hypothetical protein